MIENKCKTSYGYRNSFSINNFFYDKMDLRLFYSHMTLFVNTHDIVYFEKYISRIH